MVLLHAFFAAFRTYPIQIVGMAEQLETVFIRNAGLQPFNSVTVKFYRLSALLANQMIMMRLGRDRFKAGCAVSKLQFQREIQVGNDIYLKDRDMHKQEFQNCGTGEEVSD